MIKNVFLSLGINFINFLFPVILIPYYIHVFGITNYGLIAIALSLINYISVINDYSWNILGPVQVGKLGTNTKAISNYVSTVINTKLLLSILSFSILLGFVQLYPDISNKHLLLASIFVMLFSRTQNAHWIFIGLNDVFAYFVINTIFKVSAFVSILLFVKDKNAFQILFFILGFFDSLIFISSYTYLFLKKKFKYNFSSFDEIRSELRFGFKMFLTNLTICSILNSGTLILGLLYNSKVVGIYSVAEKVIMLGKHCVGVLFQGVFPKICKLGVSNLPELNKNLRLIFKSYLVLFSIGTVILIAFAPQIIRVLSNSNVIESSKYLMMFAPIPLIASLNQSAYMSLVIHEKKNIYFLGYFLALIINIILSFVLSFLFEVKGMIVTLIITELFITLFLNYYVYKDKNLNFFHK